MRYGQDYKFSLLIFAIRRLNLQKIIIFSHLYHSRSRPGQLSRLCILCYTDRKFGGKHMSEPTYQGTGFEKSKGEDEFFEVEDLIRQTLEESKLLVKKEEPK